MVRRTGRGACGELGIHLNLARFHLHRLEAVDLVAMRPSPRGREVVCFLPRDLDLWEDPRTRVLFGGSRIRQVALVVAEHPGITTEGLAKALSLSAGAIQHHLNTLLSNELVGRVRIGRSYRYYATKALEAWSPRRSR